MSGAGYSGTPLAKKLGIKEGYSLATFAAPAHFPELLEPFPAGAVRIEEPADQGPYDVLVVFVQSERELVDRFGRASEMMDPHSGLWVGWPKQSSPLASDLKEGHVRAHGLSTGLVDNKVCAIDSDWSGLRFVIRKENRPPRR